MKQKRIKLFLLASLFVLPFQLVAKTIELKRMSSHQAAHQWIFSFYLNSPTQYRTFTLKNPDRFIMDLKNVETDHPLRYKSLIGTPIKSIRFSPHHDKIFRVVFDLDMVVDAKVREVASNEKGAHKLQVIFYRKTHRVVGFDWPLKGAASASANRPDILREPIEQNTALKKKRHHHIVTL